MRNLSISITQADYTNDEIQCLFKLGIVKKYH
ncbi:MAG: hypothetical protein ACI9AP_000001, partial [Flavobacteriales bacterium]